MVLRDEIASGLRGEFAALLLKFHDNGTFIDLMRLYAHSDQYNQELIERIFPGGVQGLLYQSWAGLRRLEEDVPDPHAVSLEGW